MPVVNPLIILGPKNRIVKNQDKILECNHSVEILVFTKVLANVRDKKSL